MPLAVAIGLNAAKAPAGNVFICDSKTSIAYHATKDCKELNRCTHTIIEVTSTKAEKEYSKRKCKVCY